MWLLYLVAFLVIVTVAVIISMRSAVELKEEDKNSGYLNEPPKTVGQRYIDLVMNHKRNDKKALPQQKKAGKV